MQEKRATPNKKAALEAIHQQFSGNSTAAQRDRLREAFQCCLTLTTLEIRRWLDIMHPAGRVQELRAEGMQIATLRLDQATETGVRHSVGMYVYAPTTNPGVAS